MDDLAAADVVEVGVEDRRQRTLLALGAHASLSAPAALGRHHVFLHPSAPPVLAGGGGKRPGAVGSFGEPPRKNSSAITPRVGPPLPPPPFPPVRCVLVAAAAAAVGAAVGDHVVALADWGEGGVGYQISKHNLGVVKRKLWVSRGSCSSCGGCPGCREQTAKELTVPRFLTVGITPPRSAWRWCAG